MSGQPESPAPAPAERSGTATGPAGRIREDAAKARTLLSGALLEELARRVLDYENAITWDTSCTSCARVLDSAAAERERAEAAEEQVAEVRQTIAAFFTHHGNSAVFALRSARDLAEGIRQVLDRAALEPLSAVCTGPDCGEQFADSETSEYLFATRERMERLLYADGWQSDPVLCPACQPGND